MNFQKQFLPLGEGKGDRTAPFVRTHSTWTWRLLFKLQSPWSLVMILYTKIVTHFQCYWRHHRHPSRRLPVGHCHLRYSPCRLYQGGCSDEHALLWRRHHLFLVWKRKRKWRVYGRPRKGGGNGGGGGEFGAQRANPAFPPPLVAFHTG